MVFASFEMHNNSCRLVYENANLFRFAHHGADEHELRRSWILRPHRCGWRRIGRHRDDGGRLAARRRKDRTFACSRQSTQRHAPQRIANIRRGF